MVKLYCMRCKKKQEIDAKKTKIGANRFAWKGKCPKCDTTCMQFCAKNA
jgi:hypothetical protein